MDSYVKKREIKKMRESLKKNKRDSNRLNRIKIKLKSTKYPKVSEKQKFCKKELKNVSSPDEGDYTFPSKKEITTGKGLAVPISEGEEIVSTPNSKSKILISKFKFL